MQTPQNYFWEQNCQEIILFPENIYVNCFLNILLWCVVFAEFQLHRLGFFVQWHIYLYELFNVKAILVEEQ